MTQPGDARFPPQVLREYALLADGERGALIGPHGEIVWMCWPRWHDEPVFSSLIGDNGVYAITPAGRHVWGGYYEEGTLIWHSRWITSTGVVESREALAFPAGAGRAVLLREIAAWDAPARLTVTLAPQAGFSGDGMTGIRHDRGVWSARLGAGQLRWSGDAGEASVWPAEWGAGEELRLSVTLHPGERRHLVLELSPEPFGGAAPDARQLWRDTRDAWEKEVPPLRGTVAGRDARHAYAVLRGLTSTDGGMVAAATTSLPERAEAGRNYDYRYAWIRDQCLAGQACAAAGATPLLDRAAAFVTARLHDDGPRLAPAYTVSGQRIPPPRRLNLPGYPGGFDLVGNKVSEQFQLDGFGEALLLLAAAARRDRLDAAGWRAIEIAAAAIRDRWREPDAGIWEIDPDEWTHSRLICVAGLRAASAAGHGRRPEKWRLLADEILARTAARATHPSGRWQRSAADDRLDAALLLPPLRGAAPTSDSRTNATLRAYCRELTEGGYAYRFRHGDQPLTRAEGAFLLCGFVTALAWRQQGNRVEAFRWFERHRAACGPPGLFTEEFDVAQRQLRGNLPQAFVHALMLECSARLAEPGPAPPGER